MSDKIRVGVLRGGISSEYDVSLKTGANILANLPEDKYSTVDILIDKDGQWHIGGLPITGYDLANNVDVVWNALHGQYGEDGQVQKILETLGIAYTGSDSTSSLVGMNKALTKERFRKLGIKTPAWAVALFPNVPAENYAGEVLNQAKEIYRKIPPPWIIKPLSGGSSIGITIARSFSEIALALETVFESGDDALAEEFIMGKEATCGVVDNFRGEKTYALLPTEIRKPHDSHWKYEDKYNGKIEEICPGNFSREESKMIQELATQIHEGLGLRHYSRSDFIVHAKRGIYALEVNTLPGLTSESLLPKSLAAVGANLEQFLDHVLTIASDKKLKPA